MRSHAATLLTVLVVVALAQPAPAAAARTWVVHGAGYGHGVGMSAWGAYGFAKHGRRAGEILHHYYSRIRIEPAGRRPPVRVLLTVDPGDASFTGAKAACGRRLESRRRYRAHRSGSSVQLLSGSGTRLANCGRRLRATGGRTIHVDGVGTYRGALEVVTGSGSGSGALNVVNRLGLEDYVRGTLPAEVYPSWPREALEAMAIAMRSIALSTDVGGHGFDLYPDTRTQVYGGFEREAERTDRAVARTAGKVVTFRGRVAQATYFSSSGGRTESGFLGAPEVPYLQSVKDPYDYYAPQHRWTVRFSAAEINSRLAPYVDGRLQRIEVLERGDSPRIDWARLIGSGGADRIRGDTLQQALGLYDRWARFKRVKARGAATP